MTKKEVIKRYCELSATVQEQVFKFEHAADCFCGLNNISDNAGSYQYENEVIEFIESAVKEKIDSIKVNK